MKCIDCKLVKFDGTHYRCPAHPYAENIDLYTEHEGCAAPVWYPKYLEDRVKSITDGVSILAVCLVELEYAVEALSHYGGYGKMVYEDVKELHSKYDSQYKKMMEEGAIMIHELERINGKPKESL